MEGLETNCDNCKWIIVDGGTCHDAQQLGGALHYDHGKTNNVDPYGEAHYTATDGLSESVQTLYNGYSLADTTNRAIVLWGADGMPLACGILKKHAHPTTFPKLHANIRKLPNYPSDPVEGKVRLDFYSDNTFHVGMNVMGLPQNCALCSIAVYQGTTCNSETNDFGDHYWDANRIMIDPWSTATGAWYGSDADGNTNRIGFYLYDAYTYDDHMDHVVIFKDTYGFPVACGELRDSSNYVWKETEAAITGAIEANGGLVQPASMADPIVAGVEMVQSIENFVANKGSSGDKIEVTV